MSLQSLQTLYNALRDPNSQYSQLVNNYLLQVQTALEQDGVHVHNPVHDSRLSYSSTSSLTSCSSDVSRAPKTKALDGNFNEQTKRARVNSSVSSSTSSINTSDERSSDLISSAAFTNFSLRAYMIRFPACTELSIAGSTQLTTIFCLLNNRTLIKVNIANCSALKSEMLGRVLPKLPALRDLNASFTELAGPTLEKLSDRIVHLDISGCKKIKSESYRHLKRYKDLMELRASKGSAERFDGRVLKKLPDLRLLELNGRDEISAAHFKSSLGHFTKLNTLLVRGCSNFNDDALEEVANGIRVLDVSHTGVSGEGLADKLFLLKQVEELRAEDTDFNDDCLTQLSRGGRNNVKILSLNGCEAVTSETFKTHLGYFFKLEELHLERTNFDASGLPALPLSLTVLELFGCDLKASDYLVLIRLQKLKKLILDPSVPDGIIAQLKAAIPGLTVVVPDVSGSEQIK